MAKIIGGIATSHAPQLLMPALQWSDLPTRTHLPRHAKPNVADDLTDAAKLEKEKRCWDAIGKLRDQLTAWKPDLIFIMGDDQHENILDDNMPPFTMFIGEEVDATQGFKYLGVSPLDQRVRYKVAAKVARNILENLMENGFDPGWSNKTRDEAGLGHAFGRPLKFLSDGTIPIVPLMVNTYYPPAPSAKRCLQFGKALRKAIEEIKEDLRVVVIASGGLVHTVIDEDLDREFLDALARNDHGYMAAMPADQLIEGTSELRNWIMASGVMDAGAEVVDYVPCYRNTEGIGCGMGFALWK
jgi:3-O-methylgallate 3,4-dioxygenase